MSGKRSVLGMVFLAQLFLIVSLPACWSSNFVGKRATSSSSITYELFTRQNPTKPQVLRLDDLPVLRQSNFNSSLPTKIFVHGWVGSPVKGYEVRDEYLKKEDCNFIAADWSELAGGMDYFYIVRNYVSLTGRHSASFIDFLIREKGAPVGSFHLIGHSLGAHVAGEIGENLASGKIPRITGLDPARPGYSLNDTDNKLDVTDALFVDIIHSDSGNRSLARLGFYEPMGHVNFYPNGGARQPGCNPGSALTSGCDHYRSITYFAESITSTLGFKAVECADWEEFQAGRCDSHRAVLMGDPTPSTARGVYFLRTNAAAPYAIG